MRKHLILSSLVLATLCLNQALQAQDAPATLRVEGRLLDQRLEIQLPAGTPGAELAGRRALADARTFADRVEAALDALNRTEEGPQTVSVDRDIAELLGRAQQFCLWSRNAHGPLGAELYDHARRTAQIPIPPPPSPAALESATCDRLFLEAPPPSAGDTEEEADGAEAPVSVTVAAGSRLSLEGFLAGALVDRMVESLKEQELATGRVSLGRILRAYGDGPEGEGWPVLLPVFEGYERPLGVVRLRDQALAICWRADDPPDAPRWIDQRTGEPQKNLWATVAVTELAVDAQGLAVATLVMSSREGEYRVATLKPEPSVLWLLGRGTGRPLMTQHNWSALDLVDRRPREP